jgi:DNA-directed RNA polymerase subunit H (RpoH/RPB5)
VPEILLLGSNEGHQNNVHSEIPTKIRQMQLPHIFLHHPVAAAQIERPGDPVRHHLVQLAGKPRLDIRQFAADRGRRGIRNRPAVHDPRISLRQRPAPPVAIQGFHPPPLIPGTLNDQIQHGASAGAAAPHPDQQSGVPSRCLIRHANFVNVVHLCLLDF